MITEIKNVTITDKEIILEGNNLETIFTSDDLYEELPEEEVKFVFDRSSGNLKYLWKICSGQRHCKNAKSMGEKLEKLEGCIISLSENFIKH